MDAGSVIGAVVVVIVATIGVQLVWYIVGNANFTGMLKTVTDNIPIFMAIGALIAAVAWALL